MRLGHTGPERAIRLTAILRKCAPRRSPAQLMLVGSFKRLVRSVRENVTLKLMAQRRLRRLAVMERDLIVHELPQPYHSDSGVERARGKRKVDAYFSADVETDGPIPGPYSMLSFAIVYAGSFDGEKFIRPANYDSAFYAEVKPISNDFEQEALNVNKLDRKSLILHGDDPVKAMSDARLWIKDIAGDAEPVLVAYPLSFDWTWLYWYFVKFSAGGSPFGHSRCFDIKTALAVKSGLPIASSGRSKIPSHLRPNRAHTHHALDDAKEQAEIFGNIFEWGGVCAGDYTSA